MLTKQCPVCGQDMRLLMYRPQKPKKKPRLRVRTTGKPDPNIYGKWAGWRDHPVIVKAHSVSNRTAMPALRNAKTRPEGERDSVWVAEDPEKETSWVCPSERDKAHVDWYDRANALDEIRERRKALPFFYARRHGLLAKDYPKF